MRIAFTIILNGLHHLLHNDYGRRLPEMVDLWVIVDGAAQNIGSTSWCKEMPAKYHNNGASVDGTVEYIKRLTKEFSNIQIVLSDGMWKGKDAQVNAAISMIKKKTNKGFLWEIDCDEQWSRRAMDDAEQELIAANARAGSFLANFYVGKTLLAKGEWGEGKLLPYNRLWDWGGEYFDLHEPPELIKCDNIARLLKQKFNHYAYYFEKDVRFKNDWYRGHENILEKWETLQEKTEFPQPISALISGPWGKTNTRIVKI